MGPCACLGCCRRGEVARGRGEALEAVGRAMEGDEVEARVGGKEGGEMEAMILPMMLMPQKQPCICIWILEQHQNKLISMPKVCYKINGG